jgi:hypothetical protein
MADVLKLAMDRRAELQAEVARMEEFIRMADSLLRNVHPRSAPGEAPPDAGEAHEDATPHQDTHVAAMTPGVTRMNLMRRGMAAPAG